MEPSRGSSFVVDGEASDLEGEYGFGTVGKSLLPPGTGPFGKA